VDKWVEQGDSFDPFNNPTCDDCTKKIFGRFLRWQSEHPLDTPLLQKAVGPYMKKFTDFENICPIPESFKVDSEGQRLISGINTFIGIGVVGLIYAVFM
jgi:hypothetical protein